MFDQPTIQGYRIISVFVTGYTGVDGAAERVALAYSDTSERWIIGRVYGTDPKEWAPDPRDIPSTYEKAETLAREIFLNTCYSAAVKS